LARNSDYYSDIGNVIVVIKISINWSGGFYKKTLPSVKKLWKLYYRCGTDSSHGKIAM
jgi:hypothetical protein